MKRLYPLGKTPTKKEVFDNLSNRACTYRLKASDINFSKIESIDYNLLFNNELAILEKSDYTDIEALANLGLLKELGELKIIHKKNQIFTQICEKIKQRNESRSFRNNHTD